MDSALDLYGALWCPACRRVKKFLQEQRVPFTWHADLHRRGRYIDQRPETTSASSSPGHGGTVTATA